MALDLLPVAVALALPSKILALAFVPSLTSLKTLFNKEILTDIINKKNLEILKTFTSRTRLFLSSSLRDQELGSQLHVVYIVSVTRSTCIVKLVSNYCTSKNECVTGVSETVFRV